MIYDFHIFFIDKYMFPLRICRYSLGNLMIEILKVAGKCKIYWNKESQGRPGARHLTKKFASVAGMVTLGIDWDINKSGQLLLVDAGMPGSCFYENCNINNRQRIQCQEGCNQLSRHCKQIDKGNWLGTFLRLFPINAGIIMPLKVLMETRLKCLHQNEQ